MKASTKEKTILILLFFIILSARLFFVFQETGFGYEAYNELRQTEHIKESGKPLFEDELSYSGRNFVFPPLFNYLLAMISSLFPLYLVAKIMPSIMFAGISIIIYLITSLIW